MADPCRFRIFSRKQDGITAHVGADDGGGQFFPHAAAGLVAQFEPEIDVEVQPALEAEPLAR